MTDIKATPATEPVCEWCGAYKSRHMDAYYYGFSATESPEVDRILCSVARAGKGAHHTESWDEYGFVQKIQDAAIACAARIAADAEKLRAKDEEIERLKGSHDEGWRRVASLNALVDSRDAELATARAQVETLREALKKAIGLCDCSDYNGKALIPCTEANPCAGCCTTRTGQAALAATEPKGEAK